MKASDYWFMPETLVCLYQLFAWASVHPRQDSMCNYLGQERWVADFDNVFHDEFSSSVPIPWIVAENGKIAGEVRSAGGDGFTAGNLTFVTVHEAGSVITNGCDPRSARLLTGFA